MDATAERIWSAYGSSPGLIDLDHASAPGGSSTPTGAASLSADIFARWGSHAAEVSSLAPMPFAGSRLQRSVRTGARGKPAGAGPWAATAVVARAGDCASTSTTPSNALPLGGLTPVDAVAPAESMAPPVDAIPATADRAAKAQATPVTRPTQSAASTNIAPAASVARGEPLVLRAISRRPDAAPASRATGNAGGVDERHVAGTSDASSFVAANGREAMASASEPQHGSPGSTAPQSAQAPSRAAQAGAAPGAIAASGQSTTADGVIRVQASARAPGVKGEGLQGPVATAVPSATVASPTESVPHALVMYPRVPFRPLIWRKAARAWSGSPLAVPRR